MNDWAHVSDRLPDEDVVVICYDGDTYSLDSVLNGSFIDTSITHWHPLPAPPSEAEDRPRFASRLRMHADELDGAADMAAEWAREIAKDPAP